MSISRPRRVLGTTSFVAMVVTLMGCEASGPTQIKSNDGKFEITVSEGMTSSTKLHDEGDIQAANEFKELYVIVLTEPKLDFEDGFLLTDYRDLVYDSFAAGIGATPGDPTELKTNAGHEALLYEAHGTSEGIKIAFLVAFIDTGEHFHQVLTWTLESRFADYKATLKSIATSLKPTS